MGFGGPQGAGGAPPLPPSFIPATSSIQSRIDAAVLAGFTAANPCTVFAPGVYTEAIVLAPGITVSGMGSGQLNGSVTISSSAGGPIEDNRFRLDGLTIWTNNGDTGLRVGGTDPVNVEIRGCHFRMLGPDATGMDFTNSDPTSRIRLNEVQLFNETNEVAIRATGAGKPEFRCCEIESTGAAGLAVKIAAGTQVSFIGSTVKSLSPVFACQVEGQLVLINSVLQDDAGGSLVFVMAGGVAVLSNVTTIGVGAFAFEGDPGGAVGIGVIAAFGANAVDPDLTIINLPMIRPSSVGALTSSGTILLDGDTTVNADLHVNANLTANGKIKGNDDFIHTNPAANIGLFGNAPQPRPPAYTTTGLPPLRALNPLSTPLQTIQVLATLLNDMGGNGAGAAGRGDLQ